MKCKAFHRCNNEANGLFEHRVLASTPICDRCAVILEVDYIPFGDEEHDYSCSCTSCITFASDDPSFAGNNDLEVTK